MTRALVAVLLASSLAMTSCRFERRPEPEGSTTDPAADTAVRVTGGPVEDSARAVVRAFHDALRVGDAARVASLSVPGATVVDQEEGVQWRITPGTPEAGRLPGPLGAAGVGLGWQPAGSDFVAWEGSALLVDRYRATVSGETVPWSAVETFVFERGPDGWRIRHVHRSRGGPTEDGPGSFDLPDGAPPSSSPDPAAPNPASPSVPGGA